jgi:hypothetical protein
MNLPGILGISFTGPYLAMCSDISSLVCPEMPRFHFRLVLAPKAEVSPVGLSARMEQIRCGDDGYEPLRFPSGLV